MSRRGRARVQPHVSMLSPYLHFGQISPVEIALAVRAAQAPAADRASLPRGTDRAARTGRELRRTDARLRPLCVPAALGAADPRRARRDPRPLVYSYEQLASAERTTVLERGDARDARHRLHAQPHAHVLGQEGPRVVCPPEQALRNLLRLNNTYFHRRARRQLLRQCRLGLRAARPAVAAAADLRQGALHERGRPAAARPTSRRTCSAGAQPRGPTRRSLPRWAS